MDRSDDGLNLDIFKAETTYQNDYKELPLINKTLSCKREPIRQKVEKRREQVPKDNETFVKLRPNVRVPFNLLWRPKEITNTNPHEPFVTPVIPERADKEAVRKTRPRVYMSPAVSIDDVDDPQIRKIICDQMYTSEWTKAIQESEVQSAKRRTPNTTICTGDPVHLRIDLMPPLPETFRNKGKAWENVQLKMTVDPTKTFWEHKHPPVKCGACYDPITGMVSEETKQQIRDLIRRDRLRLAHDYPMPGYAGYRPRFSYGVPLKKVDMPVVHPYLSVAQAITKRYAEDESTK